MLYQLVTLIMSPPTAKLFKGHNVLSMTEYIFFILDVAYYLGSGPNNSFIENMAVSASQSDCSTDPIRIQVKLNSTKALHIQVSDIVPF